MKYITKKQISDFIKNETERLKINENELLKEVKYVLFDLMDFPDDNKNQIKFYNKVYRQINK